MNWDPVTTFNLVLSAAICAVGIVGWARVRNALALYIGLAFGLFALSHGTTILGKAESLEALLILLHAVGYILIAIAIYRVAFPRRPRD